MGDLQVTQNITQSGAPPESKEKPTASKKSKKTDDAPTSNEMNMFFEELAQLKDQISGVRGTVDEIKSIHDKALNNVISEAQNSRKHASNARNCKGARFSYGQGK